MYACFCNFRHLRRAFAPTFCQRNLNSVVVGSFCSAVSEPALICCSVTEMEQNIYRPPPQVRGMTCLDREAFTQTITVPALRVPIGVLNKVMKSLRKSTIKQPGLPRVIHDKEECSDFRLVLLDPHKITSPASFNEDESEALRSFDVAEELQKYELQLTYHNLKTEEVLEAVLPQGQDVTSAFSRVGHIAHMNLREHQLPYKNLIGKRKRQLRPSDLSLSLKKQTSLSKQYLIIKKVLYLLLNVPPLKMEVKQQLLPL